MSLRDRLDCFADFVGMILLSLLLPFNLLPCLPAVRLRLPSASSLPPTAPSLPAVRLRIPSACGSLLRLPSPSPNYFLRVLFSTLFAADLKVLLPIITSPISGAANSNMSVPMRFAAGTTYFRKKRNSSSLNNLCKSPKSHSPLSSNRSIVWNFYLS